MLQEKRGQATNAQIKDYVLEQTGLKVSSLYISQVKRKCGLDVGEMQANGYTFYLSVNGVWLTKSVPVSFLQREGR